MTTDKYQGLNDQPNADGNDEDLAISSLYASSKVTSQAPDYLKVNIDKSLSDNNKPNYWYFSLAATFVLSVVVILMFNDQSDKVPLEKTSMPIAINHNEKNHARLESEKIDKNDQISQVISEKPEITTNKPVIEERIAIVDKKITKQVFGSEKIVDQISDNAQEELFPNKSSALVESDNLISLTDKPTANIPAEVILPALDNVPGFAQQLVENTSSSVELKNNSKEEFKRFSQPDDWLQDIERLLDDKESKIAKLSVVAFREKFPEHTLSARIQAFLSEIKK